MVKVSPIHTDIVFDMNEGSHRHPFMGHATVFNAKNALHLLKGASKAAENLRNKK